MPYPERKYEVRCPVYGFIELYDWEREIINHPAFQRLRRIRQLSWTDYIYPGAMHTRFEHSLGVLHMASLLYDGIINRSRKTLIEDYKFNSNGLERDRVLVRLAALLHDVGHAPFSHASEDLFPLKEDGSKRYEHEDYSSAIVRKYFTSIIDNHSMRSNYDEAAKSQG